MRLPVGFVDLGQVVAIDDYRDKDEDFRLGYSGLVY